MGKQLGFYLNQQFCMGCKTCQITCKDKHDHEVGVNFVRVTEFSDGEFMRAGSVYRADVRVYWVAQRCGHCAIPRCAEVCGAGAIGKRTADGTVTIDPELCTNCGQCSTACPYGAPQLSAKKGKAVKCDLCADYRAAGKEPACVAACPMRIVEWGEVEELKKRHPEAVAALAGLPEPALTEPNILYTPHRHARVFRTAPALTLPGELMSGQAVCTGDASGLNQGNCSPGEVPWQIGR